MPDETVDLTENTFGKIRGRFDEDRARQADRALCDAALAALVAMPPAEFSRFVTVFNHVFRPVAGTDGFAIIVVTDPNWGTRGYGGL